MKNALATLFMSAICTLVSCIDAWSQQTNSFPDLPEQFDGITNTVDFNPDFKPAAIYRVRGTLINFVCMGTMYPSGEKEWSVIVPDHLFLKEASAADELAVRIARPDSRGLVGFITEVTATSKDWFGSDVAVAKIGIKRTKIEPFSEMKGTEPILFYGAETVMIKKVETKKLRSLVTGKEMKILGYGVRPTKEFLEANKETKEAPEKGRMMDIKDEHPYIVIEMKSMGGHSGCPFFDENGRLFILHGAPAPNEGDGHAFIKQANAYSLKKYGREISGAALLSGPIILDRTR